MCLPYLETNIFSHKKCQDSLVQHKSAFLNSFLNCEQSEGSKWAALWPMLRQEGFFPIAFYGWICTWIFCWSLCSATNAFLLAFLIFWQTKDLPVQSERPSYPPPLFLSPCVNYGSCGLVLHYQDPRVPPASRRAHEQQQHSVRFPPSPVSQGHWFFSQHGDHRKITWCCHSAIPTSY